MEWGRKVVELKKVLKSVSILEFFQWLADISEAVMYVDVPDQDQEKRKKYVSSTSIQQEETVLRCKYCKKDGHEVENSGHRQTLGLGRDNKVYFTCLASFHHTKFCESKEKCDINGCLSKHNLLLHKEPETKSEDIEEKVNHHINTAKNVF
ncbi:hypothetical protein JTB14_036411 [Gonioctena quinquepunctata]|nr:hypothetical protein JTB14_036411 [Gonioctena quinquepunctata]